LLATISGLEKARTERQQAFEAEKQGLQADIRAVQERTAERARASAAEAHEARSELRAEAQAERRGLEAECGRVRAELTEQADRQQAFEAERLALQRAVGAVQEESVRPEREAQSAAVPRGADKQGLEAQIKSRGNLRQQPRSKPGRSLAIRMSSNSQTIAKVPPNFANI